MRRYEGKAAGILGTVILHLLAGILFFSVKLNSLKRERETEFLLVFEAEKTVDELVPNMITLPDQTGLSDIDLMIRNIVRNLANPDNPVIDPEKYQDMVKEELISRGILTEDNFIDDWKKRQAEQGDIEIGNIQKEQKINPLEEKEPINYQGPSRVYYRLENRFHLDLPVPVYKCKGAGKVTVSIEVDRYGTVSSAKIDASESSSNDPCLLETAINSAMESRFNTDLNAAAKQQGTITFHFVAQ